MSEKRRYLVTYDDAIAETDTPRGAVLARADDDSIPFDATVFAIDLDAAIAAGAVTRFRVGAEELPLEPAAGEDSHSRSEP